METAKRAWYDRPGPVFALIAAIALCGFVFMLSLYTFKYYRAMRSGASTPLPQFASAFSPGKLANAAAAGKLPSVDSKDAPSIGRTDAPIVIVEFGDFECPYSKEAYPAIRQLAAERQDLVRYVWRDYPLEDIHPEAKLAAVAASCADRSGKFWQMHDKLFANQDALGRDDLIGYATQIGLDKDDFAKCLDAGGEAGRIAADIAAGTAASVRGTPTFFVNGARIEGAVPYDILNQIVDRLSGK